MLGIVSAYVNLNNQIQYGVLNQARWKKTSR